MRSSKRAALAAGALVVATVTGCSVHPGAAAVVDGRTISEDYLTEASTDLEQETGGTLALLIAAPYFIEVADENGIDVTVDDAQTAIQEGILGAVPDPGVTFGDGAIEIIRLVLAARRLSALPNGSELMSQADALVMAQDMDINPRYGEMDPASGQIARDPLPWIVSSDA